MVSACHLFTRQNLECYLVLKKTKITGLPRGERILKRRLAILTIPECDEQTGR